MTAQQSQYWAYALTVGGPVGTVESLSRSIANAKVDLNPHQVDAALFALRSPLSKGVILADEVGLGKTIEAGIVIAQRWAEKKRKILLIVPAMLRKQWQQELMAKFFLPCTILDGATVRKMNNSAANPFDAPNEIIICSYHFAAANKDRIRAVPWDIAVIDEAHRLRNVYKTGSKTAHDVTAGVQGAFKLLLTATPLQNTLNELYGLVSVIDEHVFGDIESFRDQFTNSRLDPECGNRLRDRIAPICIRTLRKQVVEYIPFTRRISLTWDFQPTPPEQELYEKISTYLQRGQLFALPASQRALITLVLRKLLSSSTFAIAHTLPRLVERLENLSANPELLSDDDLDGIEEIQDEMLEAEPAQSAEASANQPPQLERIRAELAELRAYARLASEIRANAKGQQLIPALATAFERIASLGAQRKAVIFTESRRTQAYLFDLLSANGYAGQIALINSSNSDPESHAIYQQWLERHKDDQTATGSRSVDIKAAIVEHFRDHASILVATEAAAEGVNLQFCSLVVNYDLPWNPQRVEQRIGRCHRYGQKHDVVVLNFINRTNEADQRVFELLSEKFKLFDGVFGTTDEILGAVESGVDVQSRIAQIYQTCRTPAEIATAFDQMRRELDERIQTRMAQTRQLLLENVDDQVSARLRVHRDQAAETLDQRQRWLLALAKAELQDHAVFEDAAPRFTYSGPAAAGTPEALLYGRYNLDWKKAEELGDIFFRQDHPLAQQLIQQSIARKPPPQHLQFHYDRKLGIASAVEPLIGKSGWLELSKLTVQSMSTDEFLVVVGVTDSGEVLDEEICRRMLELSATVIGTVEGTPPLANAKDSEIQRFIKRVEDRNTRAFDEESLKLDRWADDLKLGLEREIKELDRQISERRRAAALARSLAEKLDAQKAIRDLEEARRKKRHDFFQSQDAIDANRDTLIGDMEKQLQKSHSIQQVFIFRWSLA
ncbi:MAG: DEAD/DEAH box helicase [Phycisphaerales bacterium]|nr:DEAD/DEAH box helicase [Phycisphaerales bacterium]